jgi:hypothetical protein
VTTQTIISDIEYWSSCVGGLLESLSGKPSNAQTAEAPPIATKPAMGVNIGVDPLPELTAGLGTITAITNLVAARSALNNTPAMEQAAEAQKLQALKDAAAQAIAHAEATGDLTPVKLLLS